MFSLTLSLCGGKAWFQDTNEHWTLCLHQRRYCSEPFIIVDRKMKNQGIKPRKFNDEQAGGRNTCPVHTYLLTTWHVCTHVVVPTFFCLLVPIKNHKLMTAMHTCIYCVFFVVVDLLFNTKDPVSFQTQHTNRSFPCTFFSHDHKQKNEKSDTCSTNQPVNDSFSRSCWQSRSQQLHLFPKGTLTLFHSLIC